MALWKFLKRVNPGWLSNFNVFSHQPIFSLLELYVEPIFAVLQTSSQDKQPVTFCYKGWVCCYIQHGHPCYCIEWSGQATFPFGQECDNYQTTRKPQCYLKCSLSIYIVSKHEPAFHIFFLLHWSICHMLIKSIIYQYINILYKKISTWFTCTCFNKTFLNNEMKVS